MAHKKGQGASRNGRDSNAQRRGIKAYGGEYVTAGSILVRQCGTKFHAGKHVGCGKDYTLYALKDGRVKYLPNRKVLIEVMSDGSTADAVEASDGSTADAVEASES